jgi:hypothetical protein
VDTTSIDWRKSTRSADQGNCVEIAITKESDE